MEAEAADLLLAGVVVAAGVVLAGFGLRELHRYWAVVDTPTSSCAGVFVGRNEVSGQAQPHVVLQSPVTRQPCVWYRWRLESVGSKGRRSTVEERSTNAPFWLVDESGSVLVRPRGADIAAPETYEGPANRSGVEGTRADLRHAARYGEDAEEWQRSQAEGPTPRFGPEPAEPLSRMGRNLRIREWRIDPGQPVYALGPAEVRDDVVALELAADGGRRFRGGHRLFLTTETEAEVQRVGRARMIACLLLGLAAAVSVPLTLAQQSVIHALEDADPSPFGSVGSGGSDSGDMPWFLALWMAVGLVGAVKRLRVHTASVPAVAAMFLYVLAVPQGWLQFEAHSQRRRVDVLPTDGSVDVWHVAGRGMLVAAGVYLGALLVLYGVRLYNRLVALKQQAAAAWSLIDVALRRRHDLLPNLVRVVAGYVAHEQRAQQAVAGLGPDLDLDRPLPPAETLPSDATLAAVAAIEKGESAGAHGLLALAEAHPALAADQVFQDLARRVTAAEDQVASARRYYNDAVTLLRNRRRTFPGLLLAPLVATPSWSLFGADPAPAPPPLPAGPAPATG